MLMVEDIFQRSNTTLNGYEQSANNQQTTITISNYHCHKSIQIRIDNKEEPSGGQPPSASYLMGAGSPPTYTALTLRGARGPEASIITLLLV
jgi:hypothetical protein